MPLTATTTTIITHPRCPSIHSTASARGACNRRGRVSTPWAIWAAAPSGRHISCRTGTVGWLHSVSRGIPRACGDWLDAFEGEPHPSLPTDPDPCARGPRQSRRRHVPPNGVHIGQCSSWLAVHGRLGQTASKNTAALSLFLRVHPRRFPLQSPRRTPWHTDTRSSPSDTAHPARALPSRGVQTIPSPLPSPHPPATSARELLRHNLRARASTPTRLPRSAAPCAHSPICLPYVAHTSYNVHTYVPAPRGAHNAPASTAACPFHMPPPTGEIPVKRMHSAHTAPARRPRGGRTTPPAIARTVRNRAGAICSGRIAMFARPAPRAA
ncbi:hypothetical protein AcV5_000891 [Taiwanofungus camphoratus]|nr:hypothetical protein AcV5_000891 [Antrodia cinnamomea]